MDIFEYMLDNKFAKNNFHATAIANGLKLAGLPFDEQTERVKRYRRWRDSKVFNDTQHCFTMAIEGKEPPVELFDKRKE
jgi:hypothetical protein